DGDAVARTDIEGGGGDRLAVDRYAAGGDPRLRLASRGQASAGDHLGDAVAGGGGFALVCHVLSRNNVRPDSRPRAPCPGRGAATRRKRVYERLRRAMAKWCTADPGPPVQAGSRVCSASLRAALRP